MHTKAVFAFAVSLLVPVFAATAHAADFIDSFDTAANVGSTFNAPGVAVSGGQLTLTRTTGSVDMGLDWRPASTGFFSLLDTPSLRIDADNATNNGYYAIAILFYNEGGSFLQESSIQSDTNAVGTFTYDVASLASIGATQWFARFRILPFAATDNPAFTFNEFAAVNTTPVPEPSSYAVLAGVAALGLVAGRRRGKRATGAVL